MEPLYATIEVRQTEDGPAVKVIEKARVRTILGIRMVEFGGKSHVVYLKDHSLYIVVS